LPLSAEIQSGRRDKPHGQTPWSSHRSSMRPSASQTSSAESQHCHFAFVGGPGGGGLFGFRFSSRPHPWKFGVKRFLAVRRSWRGNPVACFWATSLETILGGVIAIISFRPGGWMAAVCRAEVCYPFGR